jgi:hypothetical protein
MYFEDALVAIDSEELEARLFEAAGNNKEVCKPQGDI